MAFISKAIKKDDIQASSGSKYISKSGFYDVTLKTVSVDTAKSGAVSLNFNLDYEGESTTIYGLYIQNGKGEDLFGMKTFYQLCGLAGLIDEDGQLSVEDPEEQTHVLGKDKKEVTLNVLDQFTDLPIKIRVQEEYSKYNDEIKKRMVIKSFYRQEDGASAEEVLTGNGAGTQIAKDEKYANNVTYSDGLTPEDVQAWKDSKKSGGDSGAASAPAAAAATKPKGPVKFV